MTTLPALLQGSTTLCPPGMLPNKTQQSNNNSSSSNSNNKSIKILSIERSFAGYFPLKKFSARSFLSSNEMS